MSKHSHSFSHPILSTSFDHNTSTHNNSMKVLEKLPKITAFSTSSSVNNGLLLRKLKARKIEAEYEVDPYVAATVVKKYLIQ